MAGVNAKPPCCDDGAGVTRSLNVALRSKKSNRNMTYIAGDPK